VTLGYVVTLHEHQIDAVAWGVVVGAAVTAAILLPGLLPTCKVRSAAARAPRPATRRALVLLVPLLLGRDLLAARSTG
jgi:hypothetical protein